MNKTKIIIDADTGTDDAVAIIACLLSPKVEVLGITAVHGNRGVDDTAANALRLVDFLKKDVPVYRGCPHAITRNLTPGRIHNPLMQHVSATVNGEEIGIHEKVLGPLPQSNRTWESAHACSFLVDTLRNAEEKISIVAVGPLTNIATALTMAPEIVEHIGKIYIMGGGATTGNRTPVAEANFYDDPEAAQIVLSSGAEIVLTPLETSVSAPFGPDFFDSCEQMNTPLSHFLITLSKEFIKRMQLLGIYSPDSTSCGMCDWGAVVPLLYPELVTDVRRHPCQVEISGGFADGMLIIDRRRFAAVEEKISIVYGFDAEKATEHFLSQVASFS